MRLKIRDQLSIFVLATTLTSIGVLAVITWVNNLNLVTTLRSQRLSVIASLKSDQLAANLNLLDVAVSSISTRAILINGLKRYLQGNNTVENWNNSLADLGLVMSTQEYILHITVYNANMTERLLNITSRNAEPHIDRGMTDIKDSAGSLIAYNSLDGPKGFPDALFTKTPTSAHVLLGPMDSTINGTTRVATFTVPIYNNTTAASQNGNILGILTVVMNMSSLHDTLQYSDLSGLGLGGTGQILLLGASSGNIPNQSEGWPGSKNWKYVVPPKNPGKVGATGGWWGIIEEHVNQTGSTISTTNPATGQHVAIGFSNVNYPLCNWLVIVQQEYSEVAKPIVHLRNILLAAVFGTAAVIVAITCILAHFAVRPIVRLQEATEKTTRPPGYTPTASDSDDEDAVADRAEGGGLTTAVANSTRKHKIWWKPWAMENKVRRRRPPVNEGDRFRIPGKVTDGKHIINDELTDLTKTFNDMADELLKQYLHLEERVALRTTELREQTRLANAANEAKSMFIANVTHELRTPLNGILGMCSVIMAEPDVPNSVKKSLTTIYKSGDLLLCLLTDLLTFSRNQVAGINVVLEERDFRVRDLIPQVKAIFGKQAREKGVELGIEIVDDGGTEHSTEPSVNHVLRGDMNRILQVVINLLSNALKFTPEKGSVQLRLAMVPGSDIPITRPEPPLSTPSTLNAPRTAIINPNSPANQAILQEKAASNAAKSGGDTAASLAGTTPGQVSDSSKGEGAAAYFEPAHHHHSGEKTSMDAIRQEAANASAMTLRMFEFSVIDTGMGIPANMHSQIFEPFVQGDLGLSKKYGGTGLGLSICKQLAELMGGVIELKSFEGAGSTFTLRIPLKVVDRHGLDPDGNTRPGSLATTRLSKARDAQSLRSVVSTAFSSISIPVAQVQDSTRLVGLSQPFFAPEMAADDDNFDRLHHGPPPPPPPPPPHLSPPPNAPGYTPRLRSEREPVDKTATPPVQPADAPTDTALAPPVVAVTSPGGTETTPSAAAAGKAKAAGSSKDEGKKGHAERLKEPIRVLLVEDNKVNQTVVKKLLKLEDVSDVALAEDGLQAVDRIKEALAAKKKYEIIFMDVQMPNLDGIEATKKIREMGYQAPIVALTAFAEEENVQKCFDSGMDYFLSKPIRRPQLKEVLRTYCKTIREE